MELKIIVSREKEDNFYIFSSLFTIQPWGHPFTWTSLEYHEGVYFKFNNYVHISWELRALRHVNNSFFRVLINFSVSNRLKSSKIYLIVFPSCPSSISHRFHNIIQGKKPKWTIFGEVKFFVIVLIFENNFCQFNRSFWLLS